MEAMLREVEPPYIQLGGSEVASVIWKSTCNKIKRNT